MKKPKAKPPKLPEWEVEVQVQAIFTGSFFDAAATAAEAEERVRETIKAGGIRHLCMSVTDIIAVAKPDPADEVPF